MTRSHATIIADAGGWRAVRDALGFPTDDAKTKYWFFRNSIPARYWQALVDREYTTAGELMRAVNERRFGKETGRAA